MILSHETSVGKYPEDAVIQLAKSIAEGENIYDYEQVYNDMRQDSMHSTKALSTVDLLASTACSIALDNNVDLFICLTETGKIARFIAKYRPFQSILACSTSTAVVKQSNLCRGVIGYKIPSHLSKIKVICNIIIETLSDKLISLVLKVAKEQELVLPGNKVLIFYTENEGRKNESLSFKTIDLEGEGDTE